MGMAPADGASRPATNGAMSGPHLHVEVHPGHGPHLLLVHGMLSSRASWGPNLAALAQVCQPVVVELWGHGRTPAPPVGDGGAYTAASYVLQLEALRAALGIERWMACGHSLGAALVLRYALDKPTRVSAQILTNSSSALADQAWLDAASPRMDADADVIGREGAAAIERHPLHPGRSHRTPQAVREALAADCRLHDATGIAATLRYTVPSCSSRARLPESTVPALLVAGVRETSFLPALEHARAAMPLLEVAEVDAGHAVNLHAVDAFNEAVTGFIRRRT